MGLITRSNEMRPTHLGRIDEDEVTSTSIGHAMTDHGAQVLMNTSSRTSSIDDARQSLSVAVEMNPPLRHVLSRFDRATQRGLQTANS